MGSASKHRVNRAVDVAPKTRDDVTFVELDGEAVVYDEKNGALHQLNASATIVWSLCDGATSKEEISEAIAEAFSLSATDVLVQVREVLDVFGRAELLEAPIRA